MSFLIKMRRLTVLVVVISLLVLPSVFAQVYPPCQNNNNCQQGYYCIGNQCREPCQNNNDCDEGTCQPDNYCGSQVITCGNGVLDFGEVCEGPNTVGIGGPFVGDCTDPLVPCNNGCPKDSECRAADCKCGPVCGDGVKVIAEPCDASDPVNPGCSPNEKCFPPASWQPPPFPTQATAQCTCTRQPIYPPDKDVKFVLFDLYTTHNLFFAKTLDLAHINKDLLFQEDIKEVEIGLRNAYLHPPNGNPCQVIPNLFMLTPQFHPYGKENEIDAYNNLLLFILNNPALRGQVGVSQTQYDSAVAIQIVVDSNLGSGNFQTSAQAKCCLYNQLLVPSVIFLDELGICTIFPVCGNGILEPGEPCDDGANGDNCDGCTDTCTIPTCGDGITCTPEECDDNNMIDCDGYPGSCSSTCTLQTCGNNVIECGEPCDDGCLVGTPNVCEPGDNCNGYPPFACSATCQIQICGNSVVECGEECDDGNVIDNDGCTNACTSPTCPDGIVQSGSPFFEQCDPGGLLPAFDSTCPVDTFGDGQQTCGTSCSCEICGDGSPDPGEECDDGNNVNGDGCGANCNIEECGDGDLDFGEDCDDGDNDNCDGCDSDCTSGCGNNILCLGEGEECDDGDNDPGDGCDAECQKECGNGVPDPGEQCNEPDLNCAAGFICNEATCKCFSPPRQGGGSHPEVQAGCGNGGQYTISAGQAAYVIDVNGQRIDLTGQKSVAVGPVCCFDDCCNNYCSVVNPGSVCLSPAFDRNNQMLKNFLPVCRKPAEVDKKYCKDKNEVFCFETAAGPVGQVVEHAAETQPTTTSGAATRLAECANSDDCTAGFVCQDGACVQQQRPAQAPKVVQKQPFSPVLFAAAGIIILGALVFLILNRRPRVPQAQPERPVEKPVEKKSEPAQKPVKAEPRPIKPAVDYEPSKVEEDLESLEKSYEKIEEMLKSMRRKF